MVSNIAEMPQAMDIVCDKLVSVNISGFIDKKLKQFLCISVMPSHKYFTVQNAHSHTQ